MHDQVQYPKTKSYILNFEHKEKKEVPTQEQKQQGNQRTHPSWQWEEHRDDLEGSFAVVAPEAGSVVDPAVGGKLVH